MALPRFSAAEPSSQQAARGQVQATTERIDAAQRLRAGSLLDQAAGATDHPGERLVGGITEGERAAAQGHGATGNAGQRTDGLVASGRNIQVRAGTGQADRTAGGQASAAAHRHLARVDRQATGEGIRTTQRQRGRSVLDQAAGTTDGTAQGQRIAAQHIQQPAHAKVDAIAHAQRRACIQRHRTADVQCAGSERTGIADHQATGSK
ncbi:hypothetical protein G6F50_014239 [Rhizopus delemar]|uniref:SMP domain-containing protein n=1 Tax=Rhizopus delemar TaxID=936053 RepID=A0A9P6Y7K2_9FUNG|nr:hypothetical protein G6F50_014239 [Rhizopus delemar]